MENHHANGYINSFDWAIFTSELLVYQRVRYTSYTTKCIF